VRRYERASTMLTSNRPVEDWGKLLGDAAAISAMLDRLLHHGHVLKCGPRSWRTNWTCQDNKHIAVRAEFDLVSQIDVPGMTTSTDRATAIWLRSSELSFHPRFRKAMGRLGKRSFLAFLVCLFVSQRLHRINTHRPPRGEPAGKQSNSKLD
jgi:hypothetical protein